MIQQDRVGKVGEPAPLRVPRRSTKSRGRTFRADLPRVAGVAADYVQVRHDDDQRRSAAGGERPRRGCLSSSFGRRALGGAAFSTCCCCCRCCCCRCRCCVGGDAGISKKIPLLLPFSLLLLLLFFRPSKRQRRRRGWCGVSRLLRSLFPGRGGAAAFAKTGPTKIRTCSRVGDV